MANKVRPMTLQQTNADKMTECHYSFQNAYY